MRPQKTEIYTAPGKDSGEFRSPGIGEGDLIGGCLIEGRIGEGGVGVVFRARHIRLQAPRAIKVLKGDADERLKSRFLREARIAANLQHPNIVGVYNVGEEEGLNYIEMELVEGVSLRQRLEKSGALSPEEAFSIALQAGEALAYSHSVSIPGVTGAGIIHRDIKPENILVTPEGKVKITDFGLAKPMAPMGETAEGSVLGTFHYMPIEQMEGGKVDVRADVYSLSVVLYEMLTGRLPFNGATFSSLARNIRDADFPPLRQWIPQAASGLSPVLAKGLSAAPGDRFDGVGALCDALRKINANPKAVFLSVLGGRKILFASLVVFLLGGVAVFFLKDPKGEVASPFSMESAPPSVRPEATLAAADPILSTLPEAASPPSPVMQRTPIVRPAPSAREIFEKEDALTAEKLLRRMSESGKPPARGQAAYYLARIREVRFAPGRPGYPDSALVLWKAYIRDFSKDPGLKDLLSDAKQRLLRLLN